MPIEVKLEWFGEQRKAEIRGRINRGMFKSAKFLFLRVKEKVNNWGSQFITSTKRLRTEHSSPGQPPLKQTGNFEKSIKFGVFPGEDGYFIGSVYSDAEYADTLERGGSEQIDQSQKSSTTVRLVNPITKPIFIAARPSFAPAMAENRDKLIEIMLRG